MSFQSLEKLSLDDETRNGRAAKYFRNIRAALLIAFTFSAIGLASFFTLPRELNPEIRIPLVFVSTILSGADPQDIESLVTIPLEDALEGLDGLEKVSSSSSAGISTIVLEFSSGTDPEQAKADTQSAVDTVTTLPEDAKDPSIQVLDFQNEPVIQAAVLGGNSSATLSTASRQIRNTIEDLPGVKRVSVSGSESEEIDIILLPEVIQDKTISLPVLIERIHRALESIPVGSVADQSTSFSVGINPLVTSIEDLRNLPIQIGDRTEPLSHFAFVREYPLPENTTLFAGTPQEKATEAVYLRIFKTDDADITTTGTAVKETIQTLDRTLGTKTFIIFDGPKEVDHQANDLTRDFLITISLVLGILFLFFGIRQSLIAALAIPFTFLVTFTVMQLYGLSISFISLFSLLLALGILVDNAIVITAAFTSYYRSSRFTPIETALLVWRDFRGVIFTTTLTTVWAFVPLLLATGIIGEFIRAIPIVVSTALIVSALAAMFLVLPFIATLFSGSFPSRVTTFLKWIFAGIIFFSIVLLVPSGKNSFLLSLDLLLWVGVTYFGWKLVRKEWPGLKARSPILERCSSFARHFADHGLVSLDPLAKRYEAFIHELLEHRSSRRKAFIIVIGTALFSYLLFPLGFVVNEFFPKSDENLLFIGIELPEGTVADRSEEISRSILDTIRDIPEISVMTTEIGQIIPQGGGASSSAGSHQTLGTVRLIPKEERERSVFEVAEEIEKRVQNFPFGKISVTILSGGPPAGSDIEVKLRGPEFDILEEKSLEVSEWLSSQPGISNVRISPESGSGKLAFHPDMSMLAKNGVSLDSIGLLLRTASDGFTIKDDLRLEGSDERREVTLRLTPNREADPALFETITVPTENGSLLPLSSLGYFELEESPSLITREDGKRTISVSASVAEGISVSETNVRLLTFLDTTKFPLGYDYRTGGVNEENEKSVQSILLAMILSSFLIFGTMVLQLGSYRKAIIVLLVIPLAVSGVFLIFAFGNIPLSFPALIGVLALFGIVVNNSIIMVDKINKNLDHDMPVTEAIADGAASRLEPILLTAMTTIVGLIPITLSDPIWQGLGGAIIAGLLLSGVMKLFFIPLIYHAWFAETKKNA